MLTAYFRFRSCHQSNRYTIVVVDPNFELFLLVKGIRYVRNFEPLMLRVLRFRQTIGRLVRLND